MIIAMVADETDVVVTVNVAVVFPEATVTLEGTVACELLEERVTVVPPDGAALLKVTVPVEEFPPRTGEGLKLMKLPA